MLYLAWLAVDSDCSVFKAGAGAERRVDLSNKAQDEANDALVGEKNREQVCVSLPARSDEGLGDGRRGFDGRRGGQSVLQWAETPRKEGKHEGPATLPAPLHLRGVRALGPGGLQGGAAERLVGDGNAGKIVCPYSVMYQRSPAAVIGFHQVTHKLIGFHKIHANK